MHTRRMAEVGGRLLVAFLMLVLLGAGPVAAVSNCCQGRGDGAGCDDTGCEACVCGIDNFCCSDVWDGTCASMAEVECVAECLCDVPTPVMPRCVLPEDCDPGQGCRQGRCFNLPTPTVTPVRCSAPDRACPFGFVCDRSVCRPVPTPTVAGKNHGGSCAIVPAPTAGFPTWWLWGAIGFAAFRRAFLRRR